MHLMRLDRYCNTQTTDQLHSTRIVNTHAKQKIAAENNHARPKTAVIFLPPAPPAKYATLCQMGPYV